MNIYIPEIWEPYTKTWWQRLKRKSHWSWWEKTCICGGKLEWQYYPQLKKYHKRCSGDRGKCPFYREHDELVKRGMIGFIKE